jgi:hypothetical protein
MKAQALFPLGRTVATPAALDGLVRNRTSPSELLDRHVTGDWGEVGPEDWEANERDLIEGERLLSVYYLEDGTKLYCITEWDRSSTCLLLISDY